MKYKLDKDIKSKSKLYDISTCKLVTNEENCQYTSRVKPIICTLTDGTEKEYTSASKCARELSLDVKR